MIRVYGASDDLIEIEGDISEEFSPVSINDEGEFTYLVFSDSTVLSISYIDGCWRIFPVVWGAGKDDWAIEQCGGDFEDDDYSDIATYDGDDIEWVVCNNTLVKADT